MTTWSTESGLSRLFKRTLDGNRSKFLGTHGFEGSQPSRHFPQPIHKTVLEHANNDHVFAHGSLDPHEA